MAGTEIGSAWLTILPSLRGFDTTVSAQATKTAESSGRKAGGIFGEVYSKAALGPLRGLGEAAAGLFAGKEIFDFFKASIAVGREAQVQQQEIAQVIKTTGGAAGVTAAQVNKLTTSISNQTGISRLAVGAGARMLLTFTGIRNEVGKGNDVFNQSVRAVNNVAAAMAGSGSAGGGDSVRGAAIQLGKALNDPMRGLTALTRVGVTFNTQQRAQIAAMVKAGNTLGAQKVILHELNKEFGGAAAASTTMGQKVSVAFENVKERIGTALIPVIDSAEGALLKLFPALERGAASAGRFFSALAGNSTVQGGMAAIADAVGHVVDAVKNAAVAAGPFLKALAGLALAGTVATFRAFAAVIDTAAKALDAITGFFAKNKMAAGALAGVIAGSLIPAVAGLTAKLAALAIEKLAPAVYSVTYALSGFVGAFKAAEGGVAGLRAALAALNLNPVVAGLTLVAAAGAALYEWLGPRAKALFDQGAAGIDDFVKSLHDLHDSAAATATDTKAIAASLQAAAAGFGSGNIDKQSGQLAALSKALQTSAAAARQEQSNQQALGAQYGLTAGQIKRLADANGIDLSKSYDTVSAAVASAVGPTTVLTSDTREMGKAAAGSANQVNALTDAVTRLISNFVGVKQAELDFHNDLKTLITDLHKSKGSLDENTKAGNAARAQYLTTANALGTVAGAMAKNGSSTDAIRSKMNQMLGVFAKTPAGGKLVTATLAHIRAAINAVPNGKAAGERVGSDYAAGIVIGLQGKIGAVASAAADLGGVMISGTRDRIVSKSPSKEAIKIGQDFVSGAVIGLDSGIVKVATAAAKTGEAMLTGITNKLSSLPKSLQKVWTETTSALSKQFTIYTSQLDKVSARYAATAQAAKQMADAIKQSLTQNSGLSNIDLSGGGGSAALILGERSQLHKIREFIADLKKLKADHLSPALRNQILSMGPDQGLAYEQALLADPGSISWLDQTQAAINKVSSQFADSQASDKYGPTLEKQLKRLESIDKEMKTLDGDVKALADNFGQVINGAASNAKRRKHAKVAA